jgi:CRISPR/Cas system CSM-associated protein Csm3 (group 7 of RAMP superfamily)
MFRLRLNELRVALQILPDSPLLIKEGRHLWSDEPAGKPNPKRRFFHDGAHIERLPRMSNRAGPKASPLSYDSEDGAFNMAFVYSTTADQGKRLYLPGASLRGVLRSSAERLIGRWQPGWTELSDPFRADEGAELSARHTAPSSAATYAAAGPIERCFGHTALRGRWTIGDAWIADERAAQPRLVVRDGVGIDRRTGAAEDGLKYQYETLVPGRQPLAFETTLTLVNFEQWQLGLLAHLLAALDGGAIRLGYGTRRGLGCVRLRVAALAFRWYLPRAHADELPTLGALLRAAGEPAEAIAALKLREPVEPLRLPLREHKGGLMAEWHAELPSGDQADPWAVTPWSTFGPLLGRSLTNWTPPTEESP